MNAATGSLSRSEMNKTNNNISNKCTKCPNKIEYNTHMLTCNHFNKNLKSEINSFTETHKLSSKLKDPLYTVFEPNIDISLGIGSIQIWSRKTRVWDTVKTKIDNIQTYLYTLLKSKNRDGKTYHDRAIQLV